MLGKMYLTGGDLPYAEKELERAKALGLGFRRADADAGRAVAEAGARASSCCASLNARDDWPQDARIAVHELRARAFLGLDDLAGARRAYEAILGIDPRQRGCAHRSGAASRCAPTTRARRARADRCAAHRAGPPDPARPERRSGLPARPRTPMPSACTAGRSRRRPDKARDASRARRGADRGGRATPKPMRCSTSSSPSVPAMGSANYLRAAAAFQAGDATPCRSTRARPGRHARRTSRACSWRGASHYALGRWDSRHCASREGAGREPDHAPAKRLLGRHRRSSSRRRSRTPRPHSTPASACSGSIWPPASVAGATDDAEAVEAGRLARAGDHAAAARGSGPTGKRGARQPGAAGAARRSRPAGRPSAGSGTRVRGGSAKHAGGSAGAQAGPGEWQAGRARQQRGRRSRRGSQPPRRPRDASDACGPASGGRPARRRRASS